MGPVRVWAPFVRQVMMIIEGRAYPMEGTAGGWWFFESPLIANGVDYAFVLDGSDPLPDPRSPWQPYGVHGFSRFLDHSLFLWTDAQWQPSPLSSAVIYELHVGTFSPEGTFAGVADRLDYLARLGVTHVELMPVASFSGTRGWGYDGVDLYAPQESYGGPEGLKRLVDACHRKGIAVILDVVYNHLGPEGNYLERFGPYFTEAHRSPWGKAVNFDGPGSDAVRGFFIENALMWLKDYHMDALRLDAIHAITDTSAVHFLEELAREKHALEACLGRHKSLIAESDLNDPRIVTAPEAGGYGIEAQWSDDFHHALHSFFTGEKNGYYSDFGKLSDIAKALINVFVVDGSYSAYRKRKHGRQVHALPYDRFLAFLQNHDQVGNRAKGERASHLMDAGKLMAASALVFCSPFIPMIFQGEEWGASSPFLYFTDHQDESLGQAVREGRRREFAAFGWNPEEIPDPQAIETFLQSKLDWEESEREPHRSILSWYRGLISLRRTVPDLKDGGTNGLDVRYDEEAGWLILRRRSLILVCNMSPHTALIFVQEGSSVMLTSHEGVAVRANAVSLPPRSAAILICSGDYGS